MSNFVYPPKEDVYFDVEYDDSVTNDGPWDHAHRAFVVVTDPNTGEAWDGHIEEYGLDDIPELDCMSECMYVIRGQYFDTAEEFAEAFAKLTGFRYNETVNL